MSEIVNFGGSAHFDAGIVYAPYIPLLRSNVGISSRGLGVIHEEREMLYAEGINPIIMDENTQIWGQRDLGEVRVVEDDFNLTQFHIDNETRQLFQQGGWVDEPEPELITEGDRYRYRLGI